MMFVSNRSGIHKVIVIVVSALLFFAGVSMASAEQFGRFFTTAKQRQHLEELRKERPETIIEIDETEIFFEEQSEVETVPLNAITVKGLVYRKGGKSTAWINDSNSYEGDLASQYTQVRRGNIHSDKVIIGLPDNSPDIKLKVGQTYEPGTDQFNDIVKETGSFRIPAR